MSPRSSGERKAQKTSPPEEELFLRKALITPPAPRGTPGRRQQNRDKGAQAP